MSILAEESIKPSVQTIEQLPQFNKTSSQSGNLSTQNVESSQNIMDEVKLLLDDFKKTTKQEIKQDFRDYAMAITFLQEENAKLKETIEKHELIFKTLGHNPSVVMDASASDSKNNNESRARLIFPELEKTKQLAPVDIINICKLGRRDYETAHRIMDMAEKLYPGECKHDISKVSGASRHWLVHKDHFGFKD